MLWLFLALAGAALVFLKKKNLIPDVPFPSFLKGIISPNTLALALHSLCALTSLSALFGAEFVGIPVKFPSFLVCLLSSVVTIITNYGAPNMSDYSVWLSNVAQSADFPFFMISMIFIAKSNGLADYIALLIIARRSLWFVATHLNKSQAESRLWKFVQPTWQVAKSIEDKVLLMSATCEIMIAFWLTLLLLTPQRQFLSVFVYWNFLRMRYQAPRSHGHHERAWAVIGDKAEPALRRLGPLAGGLEKIKRWFTSR